MHTFKDQQRIKCVSNSRTYSRNQGHVQGIMKNGQERQVKGHNFEFLPKIFSKFWTLRILHPPKQDMVSKVLTENKVFYVSKKALRANTTCNKGLK